jgi:hypothetical protein
MAMKVLSTSSSFTSSNIFLNECDKAQLCKRDLSPILVLHLVATCRVYSLRFGKRSRFGQGLSQILGI